MKQDKKERWKYMPHEHSGRLIVPIIHPSFERQRTEHTSFQHLDSALLMYLAAVFQSRVPLRGIVGYNTTFEYTALNNNQSKESHMAFDDDVVFLPRRFTARL